MKIYPLIIKALSPIHVGSGEATGDVDQPVIRDSIGIPFIPASSLKGAIKAYLPTNLKGLLGSEPGERETKPSQVKIFDAYPILFPVRSLIGLYAYATSPYLLSWFLNMVESLNMEEYNFSYVLRVGSEEDAYCVNPELFDLKKISPSLEGQSLFNEETFRLNTVNDQEGKFKKFFTEVMDVDDVDRIVMVDDSRILSLIEKSIMRTTRVALEEDVKKVRQRSLWTEEYVPRNTLYLSYISFEIKSDNQSLFESLLKELDGSTIFIGGLETIGRGLIQLKIKSHGDKI